MDYRCSTCKTGFTGPKVIGITRPLRYPDCPSGWLGYPSSSSWIPRLAPPHPPPISPLPALHGPPPHASPIPPPSSSPHPPTLVTSQIRLPILGRYRQLSPSPPDGQQSRQTRVYSNLSGRLGNSWQFRNSRLLPIQHPLAPDLCSLNIAPGSSTTTYLDLRPSLVVS